VLITEQEAMAQRCIGPEGCGVMVGIGEPRVIEHNDSPTENPDETYYEKYWTKHERRCIGSACKMAWRWHDPEFETHETFARFPPRADEGWQPSGPPDKYNTQFFSRPTPNRRGYCGLAGRPE
jgi:hypothetical protein